MDKLSTAVDLYATVSPARPQPSKQPAASAAAIQPRSKQPAASAAAPKQRSSKHPAAASAAAPKRTAPPPAPAPPASGPPLPPTQRRYLTYEGNFQLRCAAIVLQCTQTPSDDGTVILAIIVDARPFHPQGGGQPSDVGCIRHARTGAELRVAKVTFDFATGVVTHACPGVAAADADDWISGDACELEVDAATREAYSACHSAGHAVDSAMVRAGYLLPPTKGYHFLDGPYVEYRGVIPADDREPLVKKLQDEFRNIVHEDIATTIESLPLAQAEAELNAVQENFDLSVFKDPEVRVVGVAGFRCPCGGTHVRSTRLLRGYTVLGFKN